MKIKNLINNTNPVSIMINNDKDISGLTIDSRKIEKDNAFIAIRGFEVDGHNFIHEALNKGVNTLILEELPINIQIPEEINIVQYKDTQEVLGYLAANFYDHPANSLKIIAITGTKGKTTVVSMIKDLLESRGIKCATIGTMGIQYNHNNFSTENTTPDSIILQQTMREMVDHGIEYLIMEASSQGFKRKRTNGFDFDIGVILNIDRDHIGEGEHQSFEEYLQCKLEIFKKSKNIIINSGNKIWNFLTSKQKQIAKTFSVNSEAELEIEKIKPFQENTIYGSKFKIKGFSPYFEIDLPGEFNVENIIAALSVLKQLGFNILDFKDEIKSLRIPGRSEFLPEPLQYNKKIFVDFAHNQLSMTSILKSLRQYNPNKLICVFGLHWNETKMRRYDMGFSAGKYSDLAILTEDNRGFETFEHINQDVIKGLNVSNANYLIIKNRKEAIEKALDLSDKDDIILITGMGNEQTQDWFGNKVYFNEKEIIMNHLRKNNS